MTQRNLKVKKSAAGKKSRPQEGVASGGNPAAPAKKEASVFSGAGKTPWLCLLLGIVVFWTFFPALNNDFVNYDDLEYVVDNTHVQPGLTWAGVKWAFGHATVSNWHPLTMVSHMLDCQLYGLRPWGHHLTAVLLHTLNALLLFVVLRRMTGATWRSLCVAMLFGLHPLNVQSVAWIAERKNVLSTLFWLLTLWFYARFAEESRLQSRRAGFFYGSALLLFVTGLMCKPMLVTLPFVMLLLDCWPLERWKHQGIGRLLLEKIPFIFFSAVVSVVTFMVQKAGGGVATFETLPFPARLDNALVSYARYLGKFFWPENLAVLYPYPRSWPASAVLASGLMLLGITLAVVLLRRKRPWLPVGWFWFAGTLVPVIGLVQTGEQSMADRHMYVPMIGLLILVVWGLYELAGRWRHADVLLPCAAAVAAVLCMMITRQQIGFWKDNETLFRRDLAVAGGTPTAYYQMGVALNKKGDVDGAARQFQELLKLKPGDVHALFALGAIANGKRQPDEAIPLFQQVLKQQPGYAEARYQLGVALGQEGRLDDAINQYQEALRLNPGYFDAHMGLGVAFGRSRQLDQAIAQFQAALKLDPANVGALYNLGTAFNGSGQLDQAVAAFQKVIELEPDNANAHNNLGLAFSRKGQLDEAISQFQAALRLNPNHVNARNNLNAALELKGSSAPIK